MILPTLISDIKTIEGKIFSFIWSYKVGDNIVYNFQILSLLYKNKEKENTDKYLYNKPIIILIISIIEAIFFDFIFRLSQSTNHFPENISSKIREKIKEHIEKEKVLQKKNNKANIRKIKNYRIFDIIDFLKKYKLFGDEKCQIYEGLEKAIFIRNRIHIFNYHNNLEKDERFVFSEKRLRDIEKIFEDIIKTMSSIYKRC